MKRLTTSLLAAVFAVILIAGPARAADPKAGATPIQVKVAIIDMERVTRQAAVTKDIRNQLRDLRSGFQSNIQKEEEELRTANQELARKRSLLSPEAFAEERRKFEQRLMEVQRKIQKRKHELETAQSEGMKKVQDTVSQIVVDIANQEALTLILRSDQVVFWARALDITGEVLKRLDKKLPALKLEIAKKAG